MPPCDLCLMDKLRASIRRLQSMLRRRGQRREDAEDLVQEAFVRLQVYYNEGREVRAPEAFLARTVLNLAADAREGDRSHLYVPEGIEELQLIDLSPAPDDLIAAEQRLAGIRRLMKGLSPRTKDIFLMHRLHGMSYAQIAAYFDISTSAVEKHVASAMAVVGPHMHKEKRRRE